MSKRKVPTTETPVPGPRAPHTYTQRLEMYQPVPADHRLARPWAGKGHIGQPCEVFLGPSCIFANAKKDEPAQFVAYEVGVFVAGMWNVSSENKTAFLVDTLPQAGRFHTVEEWGTALERVL